MHDLPETTNSQHLLAGKVAVITGGAGGIGSAISRDFARHGATVVINDWNDAALEEVLSDISSRGGDAHGCPGDIQSSTVVQSLHACALGVAEGRVDILVNNVGDFRPPTGPFVLSTEDQWTGSYEINLLHVLRCTRAFAPIMEASGSGSIINVSTVEARRGIPNMSLYAVFKAGVDAFTRCLALELAPSGVRVNAIAPDTTDTLQVSSSRLLGGRDPECFRQWVPLGRPGTPGDMSGVALFLASDLAAYVTGTTIAVDGGTMAASGWYRRNDGSWTNMPELADRYPRRAGRPTAASDV
jgi:2-hydroxycyclohexanecarboxyl-CoA dehydrogenase